jgi:hypothetical protein
MGVWHTSPTTGRTLYDKLMRCLGEIAHTHDTD